jgi:hypothetical protein
MATTVIRIPKAAIMTKLDVLNAIASNGKVFSATFVKRDGFVREMTCRREVKKGVKGTKPVATAKRNVTLAKNNMVTVFDMQVADFRTLNLETTMKLTGGGNTYLFGK